MKTLRDAFLIWGLSGLIASPLLFAWEFQVTRLGDCGSYFSGDGPKINNRNEVVGWNQDSDRTFVGLWAEGSWKEFEVPGARGLRDFSINDRGQVLGIKEIEGDEGDLLSLGHAPFFLDTKSGMYTEIQFPKKTIHYSLSRINNSGEFAALLALKNPQDIQKPLAQIVKYSGGSLRNVDLPVGYEIKRLLGGQVDLNNNGMISVLTRNPRGETEMLGISEKKWVSLGLIRLQESEWLSRILVNDQNTVLVNQHSFKNSPSGIIIPISEVGLIKLGRFVSITSLLDPRSVKEAYSVAGVNNHGVFVGDGWASRQGTGSSSKSTAIIFDEDRVRSLNDFIPAQENVWVDYAGGINDRGAVVGVNIREETGDCFLLTPF